MATAKIAITMDESTLHRLDIVGIWHWVGQLALGIGALALWQAHPALPGAKPQPRTEGQPERGAALCLSCGRCE